VINNHFVRTPTALTGSPQTAKESKNSIETRTKLQTIYIAGPEAYLDWTGFPTQVVVVSCSVPCALVLVLVLVLAKTGFWPFFTWTRPHCLLHFGNLKALLQMQFPSAGIWVKLQQIKYNSAGGSDCDSHANESRSKSLLFLRAPLC